jgi:hypothetical protein
VISSGSCREIEKTLGLPEGWMDVEHQEVPLVETTQTVALRKILEEASTEIRLLAVYRLANSDQRELKDDAVRLVIESMDIDDLLSMRR